MGGQRLQREVELCVYEGAYAWVYVHISVYACVVTHIMIAIGTETQYMHVLCIYARMCYV